MELLGIGLSIAIGIYFRLLILFIIILLPKVRRDSKETVRYYENNLHIIVIIRQFLLFLLPLMLSLIFLGIPFTSEQLLSLIVLGLSINVFWVVQLPLLTKAQLIIDFSVDKIGQGEKFGKDILLKTNTEHVIYTRIYNLGFSTLKNFAFLIYFEEGVEILPFGNKKYRELDFAKRFSIQKCHCGLLFPPTENFQTIPPQEWFVFPVIVKSSKSALERDVTILFNSENSWGQKRHIAKMKIKN